MIRNKAQRSGRFQWRVLGAALLLTILAIYLAYDLADGEMQSSRHGLLTPARTPMRFAGMVLADLVITAAAGFAWVMLWYEPRAQVPRVKPEFDDPSKRSSL